MREAPSREPRGAELWCRRGEAEDRGGSGAVIKHPGRRALLPEQPFVPLPQRGFPRDAGRRQSPEALERFPPPSLALVLGCSGERIRQHPRRDQHNQVPAASIQPRRPHRGSLGCGTRLEHREGKSPAPQTHTRAEEADSGRPGFTWPRCLSVIPTSRAVQQELHPAGITPCRNYTRQRRQPKANTIF